MEEDVIIIDTDGSQRNAVIVRPRAQNAFGGGRPPMVRPPTYYPAPPPAYPAPVYTPPTATTVTQVRPAPVPGSVKSWIPDVVDLLAAASPLPAAPVATGDAAKDFSNAMSYAGALAASLKRADLLHTAARILEKRL
jgi:hypothetical protein